MNDDKEVLFDKSIRKLDFFYRYSGMNLKNTLNTPLDVLKHRWVYIFNLIWITSAEFLGFYCIYVGLVNNEDFIEVTSIAPCLTFTAIAVTKSIFHLKYEKDAQNLIKLIRDLEIKQSDKEQSADTEKIINDEIGFLNSVIKILIILSCTMIAVFDMTPFILIAIKYYQTQEFVMLLPFMNVFWFAPYEFIYWPFSYIHQIWAECIVLLDMGATDYLFYTCCSHIRVQFRLLQYEIENLIPSRGIFTNELYQKEEFREKFAELVKWHQDLIHCVDIIELIYSKSTLSNFLSSSVVICLTGFNVTIVNDIVVILTYLTFLFMGLMQVFFLCFFADMVSSAGMDVSNAVYHSKWYFASTPVCNQLLIMQTRAQKPCKMTAAGFADVNLNAFMRVVSTAWSYFALLQTVYDN